jgi:hypothetical protein
MVEQVQIEVDQMTAERKSSRLTLASDRADALLAIEKNGRDLPMPLKETSHGGRSLLTLLRNSLVESSERPQHT